jgi:carbon storage regulator
MLVLSRKVGEKIVLDDSIVVTVVRVDRKRVRLGVQAPPQVTVLRHELCPRSSPPPAAARLSGAGS